MKNNYTAWIVVLAACILLCTTSAYAIELDANVSLQTTCVDQYGQLCNNNAYWTVIQPNGTVLYNNTVGDNSKYSISNFTVWFNQTGTYNVLVNHTNLNYTKEFVIVVEDYKTDENNTLLQNIFGEFTMLGLFIFVGLLVLSIFYFVIQLDKEHFFIKLFLVLVNFILIFWSSWLAISTNTDASLEPVLGKYILITSTILTIVLGYVFYYFLYWILTKTGMIKIKDPK